MKAICRSGLAETACLADTSSECVTDARLIAPEAIVATSLDDLLSHGLDGLVIATPSALHADQAIHALEHGVAVFCQKPLGRDAAETQRVIDAARSADRLLSVDLCYRRTEAMQRIRELITRGTLGRIYAVDLAFHNAYGPDKSWFYDPSASGGGCVIDLGIHLVDLVLWALDHPEVAEVSSALYARGAPLTDRHAAVEDYAAATLSLSNGTLVRLACSWHLHAGSDAVISAGFFGTEGAAMLRNINGSFYDFTAEHLQGTTRRTIANPPDEWGGRAAIAWTEQLARDPGYSPEAEQLIEVARVLDRIYAASSRRHEPFTFSPGC